jgi:hypothetical protein
MAALNWKMSRLRATNKPNEQRTIWNVTQLSQRNKKYTIHHGKIILHTVFQQQQQYYSIFASLLLKLSVIQSAVGVQSASKNELKCCMGYMSCCWRDGVLWPNDGNKVNPHSLNPTTLLFLFTQRCWCSIR